MFVLVPLEQLVYSFPQATFATWWSNHIKWSFQSWLKVDNYNNFLNYQYWKFSVYPRGWAILRAKPTTCKGCYLVYVGPDWGTYIWMGEGIEASCLTMAVEYKEVFCCLSCIFPLTLDLLSKAATLNLFKQSRNRSCISYTTILASNTYKSLSLDVKGWIFVLFLTKRWISIWDCFWTWQGLLDIYEKAESW